MKSEFLALLVFFSLILALLSKRLTTPEVDIEVSTIEIETDTFLMLGIDLTADKDKTLPNFGVNLPLFLSTCFGQDS